MASSSHQFRSRDEHRKALELEEARKAGLAPAEVDEEGNEINPHIPQYMSSAPWYLNQDHPSLKHQKNWNDKSLDTNAWYKRGVKTFQASSFRKGACVNCGAMTHKAKDCTERPRKVGAKWTKKDISPDELVHDGLSLSFEAKRDRWNGYESKEYARIINYYDKVDQAKKENLKKEELARRLAGEEGKTESFEGIEIQDDARRAEDEQVDVGARVEKRVRTTAGGSTGSVRNLRVREDTAKYLLNLDVNSAYYDPKTRSMRADPNPDKEASEKTFAGDNFVRYSGQTREVAELNVLAWEAAERGQELHMLGAPSQAELVLKEFKERKKNLKTETKSSVLEQYGNAASEIPEDMAVVAQTERYVEYDRTGRVVKGDEVKAISSRYEEDVYLNNHSSVWGSYWVKGNWGYACCHAIHRNAYCTGAAGREANDAANQGMSSEAISEREGIFDARKKAAIANGANGEGESHKQIQWGTDVDESLKLDKKKLREAIEKEELKWREKEANAKGYNVTHDVEATPEEMEAYRLMRHRAEDPMKDFLS